eukprot:scaffold21867_cov86-Isochrysis_galbana.AAC.2
MGAREVSVYSDECYLALARACLNPHTIRIFPGPYWTRTSRLSAGRPPSWPLRSSGARAPPPPAGPPPPI